MNIGEEIVSSYLKYIEKCDIVSANVPLEEDGREVDVIGIKFGNGAPSKKTVYFCEVATHTKGLRYIRYKKDKNGKSKKIETKDTIISKFEAIKKYAEKHYSEKTEGKKGKKKDEGGFQRKYMFFSPVVSKSKKDGTETKAYSELSTAAKALEKTDVNLDLKINADFYKILDELRVFAARNSAEMKSPVMRLLQIESKNPELKNNKNKKPAAKNA